jgi:membrane-associated phospholipid phosphatase
MRTLAIQAYLQVRRPSRFVYACVIGVLLVPLFPTNLQSYRAPHAGEELTVALITDHYIHNVNTIVQIALPILLRDKIGMLQGFYVGLSNAIATHILKFLVDSWTVEGTRLGQRPLDADSRFNMPSGHSSMASSAAYFVSRRYGIVHALYLLPILLLTMYARVTLNAHTITAVITGALVGFLVAALFTSELEA